MICHFCNSELKDTAGDGSLKEVFLLYVCHNCKPHEVLYRKLYDENNNKLLADALRIDELLIIRNYQTNITEFYKTIRELNNLPNTSGFYKMDGIWKIPSTDIEIVKQKLNLYIVFS